MPKKVLVIYYSQSGQLRDIVKNVAHPFENCADYEVSYYNIQLEEDFSFPWDKDVFFDTFPETYLQIPRKILPPPREILDQKFDLILFGYQVWYLTPSVPVISFLKSEYAAQILKDTSLVTISATRNMWMLSQEKLKVYLKESRANLVGNIALVDRHNNYVSVITIINWMTTGNKKQEKPFPEAGVAQEEIDTADKYGKIIKQYADKNNYEGLQEELVNNGAVEIRAFLVRVEKTGNKIFKVWSKLIMKNPDQRPKYVKMFKNYLMFAIWVVSPIVLIPFTLLQPLLWWKRKKQRIYLQGITIK